MKMVNLKSPLILCEYGHAMCNSSSSLKEYQDLFYKEKFYEGGLICPNHSIVSEDVSTGRKVAQSL